MLLLTLSLGHCDFIGSKIIANQNSKGTATFESSDGMLWFNFSDNLNSQISRVLLKDDAHLKLVSKGLFILRFKSGSDKFFFWNSSTLSDSDIVDSVNKTINEDHDYDIVSPPEQPSKPDFDMLKSIIMNQKPVKQDVSLTSIVTSASVAVLEDKQVLNQVLDNLPDTAPKTKTEAIEVIQSMQFQAALRGFSSAIRSGGIGPLFQQWGIDPNITRVDDFVKAIREMNRKQ